MRFAILLALAAAASAETRLVRINLAPGADVRSVADAGAVVLNEFDGWCLATVDENPPTGVTGAIYLDDNPAAKRYVYAMCDPNFDRSRLAACGTVLTEDREGVLLRVTADGVRRLTRCRLNSVASRCIRSSCPPRPPVPDPRPLPSVSDSSNLDT